MLQMAHFSLRCVISPKTSPGRAVPPFWRRIRFITARGKAVPIWRFCVNPRIEEQAQMLITESTVSPFVPPPWQSRHERGLWAPIYVRGVPGRVTLAAIAWRQGGLIYYSVSADLPLTTAQLVAIADSTTGG